MSNKPLDKVIWITGASSGIGESLAYAYAQRGCKLILSARRMEELERVKAGCGSVNVLLLPFDLQNIKDVEILVKEAANLFGRIDVYVANGGLSQRGEASETTEEVLRKIMEINFFSHAKISRALLPFFRGQGSGKFIVMSSLAGKFGFFLRSAYSSSKHALHGFFEALRLEEERSGISVLMVCPGYIKTAISINALGANGLPHNKMDLNQENGIEPSLLAIKIIKASLTGKREIIVGGKETLPHYIKRFFPSVFYQIVKRLDPRKE